MQGWHGGSGHSRRSIQPLLREKAGARVRAPGGLSAVLSSDTSVDLAPYWNWYGFSTPFIAMEALDVVGKFFIGGLILSALMKKLAPAA